VESAIASIRPPAVAVEGESTTDTPGPEPMTAEPAPTTAAPEPEATAVPEPEPMAELSTSRGGRPPKMHDVDGEEIKRLCGKTPQKVFAHLGGGSVDNLRRAMNGLASDKTIRQICKAAKAKGIKITPEKLQKKLPQKQQEP
jgi:hypothetical protein